MPKKCNCDHVLLTPGLSFGALCREEVTPAQAYERQINDWILRPVAELGQSKNRNSNGMLAFGALLMFFEPHGQYVLGIDGHGASQRCFVAGFNQFADFIADDQIGDRPATKDIYKWARCGLFHSTKLDNKLLVDTIDCGDGIFTNRPQVGPNGVVLVNPWRMRDCLETYVAEYCRIIDNQPASTLHANFDLTFFRLVGTTMQYFCGQHFGLREPIKGKK